MSEKKEMSEVIDLELQLHGLAVACHEISERAQGIANELLGARERVKDIQRGRPLTRRERILASLAGETRSQGYLADDTSIPYGALAAELTLMVADGLCEKVGKGQYRATVAP